MFRLALKPLGILGRLQDPFGGALNPLLGNGGVVLFDLDRGKPFQCFRALFT
jgi:hypothetical protein